MFLVVKKQFLLSAIIGLLSMLGHAQDSYKVLITKGNATKIDSKNTRSVLKKGDLLTKDHSIEAKADVYIALMKPGGKPIEIKKAGIYKMVDFDQSLAQSALAKSLAYANQVSMVIDNIGNPNFKLPGASDNVERAVDDSKLPSFCPKTSSFLSYTLKFSWLPMAGSTSYKLTIYDISEEVLKEFIVKGTEYELDVKTHLNGDNKFIWQVSSIEKPELVSKMHILKYPEGKIAKEVEIELTEIKNELDPNSALSQMILAMFYEKNKMFLEAQTALSTAIKLEPNVQEYKDGYRDFLLRIGLENCIEK